LPEDCIMLVELADYDALLAAMLAFPTP